MTILVQKFCWKKGIRQQYKDGAVQYGKHGSEAYLASHELSQKRTALQ